jgi:hypothetical protein
LHKVRVGVGKIGTTAVERIVVHNIDYRIEEHIYCVIVSLGIWGLTCISDISRTASETKPFSLIKVLKLNQKEVCIVNVNASQSVDQVANS